METTFPGISDGSPSKGSVETRATRPNLCIKVWRWLRRTFSHLHDSALLTLIDWLAKASQEKKYLNATEPPLVPVYDILNAGPNHRFTTGEFIVSNCGYLLGWKRFQETTEAWTGIKLTDEEAKQQVKDYRESNEPICNLWDDLMQGFKASAEAKEDYTILLPSGRELHYYRPTWKEKQMKIVMEEYVDDRGVKRTRKHYHETPGGWRAAQTKGQPAVWFHPGKLAENLSSGASRDLLGDAVLRATAEDLMIVLHCHDELVVECDEDQAEETRENVLRIMDSPPEWATGLPLTVDAKIVKRYGK